MYSGEQQAVSGKHRRHVVAGVPLNANCLLLDKPEAAHG